MFLSTAETRECPPQLATPRLGLPRLGLPRFGTSRSDTLRSGPPLGDTRSDTTESAAVVDAKTRSLSPTCVHGDEHDRHGKEQQRGQSHKSQATICHRYGRCARVHRCDQSGFNTDTVQRIVSLVLSTSNGTDANSIFVLNASNNIRTHVYLVPVNSTSSNNTGGPIEVYQKLPIFVATSASVQPYSAAFDPSPAAPAPLTVMRRSDVDSVYESQKFLYNPLTGVIHPDWIQAPPLSSSSNPCPTPSTMTRIKDFTSAMTASATTFAAEALQTGPSDWFATAALA